MLEPRVVAIVVVVAAVVAIDAIDVVNQKSCLVCSDGMTKYWQHCWFNAVAVASVVAELR